jgi:hypothetical protein
MLAAQARTKLFALLFLLGLLGIAAWWVAGRTVIEPDRVLVAVAVGDDEDPAAYWWGGDAGSAAMHGQLSERLEDMGLRPLLEDESQLREMLHFFAGSSRGDLIERATQLEIGTIVRGRVELQNVLPLEGADFNDMVLTLHLEVVDVSTGEVHEVPSTPMRLYLWGVDPSQALERNASYVAERVAMPLAETLSSLPGLHFFSELPKNATNVEKLIGKRLAPLHLRANNYRAGLELRQQDIAEAEANEPADASGLERTRLGGILDAEFFVGERFDGKALVLRDQAHTAVPSNRLGYALSSSSERLELLEAERERTPLFEHYDFYSTASTSADGRQVAAVLANHGASKTVALISTEDGAFSPLLTHESEYFSAPLPSPNADRVAFFSRRKKRSKLALEVVDVASKTRKVLVEPGPALTMPVWSPDGATLYLGLGLGDGRVERIVAIDVATGEQRHILGVAPGPVSEEQAELTALLDEALPENPTPEQSLARAALEARVAVGRSAFQHFALAADGQALFVSELGWQGEFVGRFDLQTGTYTRLHALAVTRLKASPTNPKQVAAQLHAEQAFLEGDRAPGDSEVVLLEGESAPLRVTDNAVNEALVGWSRDGGALYLQEAAAEPRARRKASRIYRYTLPAKAP